MISKRDMAAIRAKINKLDEDSKKAALSIIESVDFDNKEALHRVLMERFKRIAATSARSSAELAAAVYNKIRSDELGYALDFAVSSSFQEGKYAAMVNTAVQRSTVEEAFTVVSNFVGYTNRDSYSKTMFGARRSDPIKPRYARVPEGSETCDFCMMLASRGFEYYTGEEGQEVHNHANCQCVYMPSWSTDPRVAGYDKDEWKERWHESIDKQAQEAARSKLDKGQNASVSKERKRIMSYYENSAKHSKEGVNRSGWKSEKFDNFQGVKEYLTTSRTQQELEHRYSELGGIYGFDKMKSQQVANAVRHTEKRL